MLKRLLVLPAAVCLAASTPAAAQRAFIGEWTLVASKSRMPDELTVERRGDDTYAFDFGGGVETIVVDGTDQPGLDGTLLSVKAEAPDTWRVMRKEGSRVMLQATWTLSNDQRTLTDQYREFGVDGSRLSVDYVYQRVDQGSGFAAHWRSIEETINSPMPLSLRESHDGGLSFADPLAKRTKILMLDGKEHFLNEEPNAGRGASYSTRRVGDRTLLITIRYDSKVRSTERLSLSSDLKTLTLTVDVVGRDRPIVLVFGANPGAA